MIFSLLRRGWLAVLLAAAFSARSQPVTPPRLVRNDNGALELLVQGKPFLALGGELHNSSTSSLSYMRPLWAKLKAKHCNTAIAPVYWELLEPAEGRFDFTLVDSMLAGARANGLRLVLLWFGSWKNGYSMYAPGWVKRDPVRFPRAKDRAGRSLQQLSVFAESNRDADAKAFAALLGHLAAVDGDRQTVIMAQVENEVGLFYTPRDYNEAARRAWSQGVPADLMRWLTEHKGKLQPELDSVWRRNGYRTSGGWEAVFGKSVFDSANWRTLSYLTEEIFSSYYYAKYIGAVAAAGASRYALPLYVNSWFKQESCPWPGRYPAGGPQAHTLDLWRAAAPQVALVEPDVYVPDLPEVVMNFHRPGNDVFLAEVRPGLRSAYEAFWTIGAQDAFGYSPFGIDDWPADRDPIARAYAVLAPASPLILANRGKGTMKGILLDSTKPRTEFRLGGYRIVAALVARPAAELAGMVFGEQKASLAGGLVINTGPDEFIAMGKGYTLTLYPEKPDGKKTDLEFCDEGTFEEGRWITTRRLNGDEGTGGGDYGFGARTDEGQPIRFMPTDQEAFQLVRFKVYLY